MELPRHPKPTMQERTSAFAVQVAKRLQSLARHTANRLIARQLAPCGTSAGANVEEAQGSHSKADFTRRINIARMETRETLYWLRWLVEAGVVSRKRLEPLIHEANEIVSILVAIVKKTRSKQVHRFQPAIGREDGPLFGRTAIRADS